MDIPGIFKIKKEVPQKDEVVEVSPEDYGINVKIPPGAMPAVSDEKPVILFGHLCPLSKSLEFPIGPYSVGPYSVSPYSVSPIYHLSSNTNLREEVEVSIQHVQNVETKEQAEQMMFMVAEPPTHGAKLVKFTPVEGKFEVNEDHGTLKTDKLGYFSIASQSLEKPSKSIFYYTSIIMILNYQYRETLQCSLLLHDKYSIDTFCCCCFSGS